MGRIHLFEFEDQKWFPGFLRDYGTDFLQFLSNKSKLFKPAIPVIKKGLSYSGLSQIIDLGSGGGGGLIWLNQELRKDLPELKICMTDLYPNISAFEFTKRRAENFDYISTPVDAREVPQSLKGLRTQFLSFHHFKPDDAKSILQNALDSGASIAVFEGQERSFASILAMILSPVSVLLTTPFIRPSKIGRILFTYLIPIVPLFVLWDGVVSSLRTYSVTEMKALVGQLEGAEKYNFDIGRLPSGPGAILYLLATPKT